MYESIRVVLMCKMIFKRGLFFRTSLSSEREPRSLSTHIVELANESHGEHRDSREAGNGAHWGREGGKLALSGPNRRGEVVARGAGSVRG